MVFIGKAPDKGRYRVVTLEDVRVGLLFDLQWCLLRFGDLVLQQQCGIPMGKQSSPFFANLACALALYEWRQSLGADSRLVYETRYVDDANLFVVYMEGDQGSRRRAHELIGKWQRECYVGGLKLEVTADGEDEWDYLETVVTMDVDGELVSCKHKNKNAGDVWTRRQLTFRRFAHFASVVPASTRRGVLIATLLRIDDNCTRAADVAVSAVELLSELRREGYPAHHLRAAAQRVSELRPERGEVWGCVIEVCGLLSVDRVPQK